MKLIAAVLAFALAIPAFAAEEPHSMTQSYSQKDLLKNWAMSVCLATVAKDKRDQDDADVTASAYMEFGHQRIEAYDQLRKLIRQYTSRHYSGSVEGEFNTMKCIDLFHSLELEQLATKLAKRGTH